LKASQLASGLAQSHHLDRSDVFELTEARIIVDGVPLLSALNEWKKARELAGPAILEACANWAERRIASIEVAPI
jgi:hypothetical protein